MHFRCLLTIKDGALPSEDFALSFGIPNTGTNQHKTDLSSVPPNPSMNETSYVKSCGLVA